MNEYDDGHEDDREHDRDHDREYDDRLDGDTARVLRLAADAAERRAEIHRAAVARGVFLDDAVEPVDERDVERMSPTGRTSSNANADDFSLDREVYREREASFGTVDEAEENAATTSYEYRPPARRFRETSRDDFDFGSEARSRLVGVSASELRAKNDELRWRRERREREERALAEERRRFEILKRELEEIEARRREQAAAKEARKVREAELRAVRMENKRLERRVRRERVAFENKARRAARADPPNNLCISAWSARTEKTSRTSRNRNDARFWRRDARRETAAFRWRVSSDTSRRRTNEDARRRCVRTTRAIRSVPRRRRRAPRHSFVEFRRRGSEPSPGQTRRRVPRRSTRGDASEPRRAAEIAVSAPPRGERSRGATSTPAGGAGKGPSPKTREDVRRDGEGSTPPARQRTRAARGGDARGRRPTRVRRSLRIAPPEPASRAADEYDINGRRVAQDLVDAPRREHFRPAPPSKQMPASGGGFRSGQRARARAEKQLRARRDDDAHYDGYDGYDGVVGYDGYDGYVGYDRAGVSEDASFYPPAMDDVYDDPRVARADSPESDGYAVAGEFAGEVGGVTVGGRAPQESEHLAPRESEHLAASLGGKGFRTALRERQLAAVEARRAANAGDGGDDDDVGIPRVNAYQAVDDTPCVGAQTFSATKGLVGLEDVEGGFDAAAGGTSPRGTRTTTRLGDGRGGREGRGRRETVRKGGEGGEG